VATYLWTKGVAAGALLVAAISVLLGQGLDGPLAWAPTAAVIGTVMTGGLLVWDLRRPERFLLLLTRPNTTSWLVKGGWCLMAIAAVSGTWMLAQLAGMDDDATGAVVLAVLAVPAAVMAAGYTAFLFAQAEGRDLWQSRWLLPDLLAQAVFAGAGLAAIGLAFASDDRGFGANLVAACLAVGALAHVGLSLGELLGSHDTEGGAVAAGIILRRRYAAVYWTGTVVLGLVAAALAGASWPGDGSVSLAVVAGLLAQVAVLSYEAVYVRAGQEVPLS
jgi:formate-dependent nitrite reductase membrane component NrfD